MGMEETPELAPQTNTSWRTQSTWASLIGLSLEWKMLASPGKITVCVFQDNAA